MSFHFLVYIFYIIVAVIVSIIKSKYPSNFNNARAKKYNLLESMGKLLNNLVRFLD